MYTDKILKSVKLVAEKENISEYNIEIKGTGKKGDGYHSKIILLTVTGKTSTEERKILNLVIKMSTTSTVVRAKLPIKHVFENECYIYNQVVPAFQKFENDVGVKKQSPTHIPLCYITEIFENCEILVFENLNAKGFNLWDRKKPMTYDHVRLVLQAYGQWHGISLALKRKQPENFEKLVKNKLNMFHHFISTVGVQGLIYHQFEELCNAWKSDPEINKLKFEKDEVKYMFGNLFSEDPDYHVILHGDSWNNNFMFKTEEDTKQPNKVRIIDWQMSALGSPIIDLSYFMYACMDTEASTDVIEMLNIYYDSLSERLRQFGCDPSEVFSFEKLLEHWRRFSKYGLVLGSYLLKFSLCEEDEIPDMYKSIENGQELEKNFSVKIADEENFLKRGRSNILHYLRNLS